MWRPRSRCSACPYCVWLKEVRRIVRMRRTNAADMTNAMRRQLNVPCGPHARSIDEQPHSRILRLLLLLHCLSLTCYARCTYVLHTAHTIHLIHLSGSELVCLSASLALEPPFPCCVSWRLPCWIARSMKRSQTLVGGLAALFALWVSLATGILPLQLSKAEQQVVQLVHNLLHTPCLSVLLSLSTSLQLTTDRLTALCVGSCRCGRWYRSAPTRWPPSATTCSSSENVQKRSLSSSRSAAHRTTPHTNSCD